MKSVSLADQVFEQLESNILSEKYAPGAILTELQLAKELGVSRTPVREAVRRLEQEGLLKYMPKGEMVLGITQEDLRDIYEIRILLEGRAVEKACAVITPEQLEQLRGIVELQEFYTAKQNADSIKNTDSAFHELLYSLCPGAAYRSTLSLLHKKIQHYRKESVADPRHAAQAAREHREIFDALAQGDAQRAGALARAHVESAKKRILGE